jgi:hypothetical protein
MGRGLLSESTFLEKHGRQGTSDRPANSGCENNGENLLNKGTNAKRLLSKEFD